MSPANPPLLREWMALPWLFMKPKLDLEKQSWKEADSVPFAKEFFYTDNRVIANKLLYASRSMIALLGALLGLVIFKWSRDLNGDTGGVISLFLFMFCPNFLAHASLATTDLGVTLFSVMSGYFLWKYLKKSKEKHLFFFALALALAFAAKYNALILGPIFLGIILFRKGPHIFFRALGLVVGVSFFVIWASYLFEVKPLLGGSVPRIGEKIGYVDAFIRGIPWGQETLRPWLHRASTQWPIPFASYVLGLAGIIRSHRAPYLHFAFGEWTTQTQWYYYFFVFLVKVTLGFLCLLLIRVAFVRRKDSDTGTNLILLAPTALIFISTCFDSTAVGIRYLFIPLAFLYVWVGGLGRSVWRQTIGKVSIIVFLIGHFLSAALSFPHGLSYFNALIGGSSQGYKYVRGSDVDWGQGLKMLKRYLDKNQINRIGLIYFGLASDPTFYGIQFDPISAEEKKTPEAKVYAISAFTLEYVDWSHKVRPTAVLGNCVYVFDFRQGVPPL